MANKSLFASLKSRLVRADARNEAGGPAYGFEPKHALAQLAATGCFNGTYYAEADEQLATLKTLVDQVADNAFLAKLAIYSRQRAMMKDMPVALLLVLSKRDPALFRQVFDRVVDNGRTLRTLVQFVRSGQFGRKGLSYSLQRAVQRWLNTASVEKLLSASIGNDPSLRDVLRLARPTPPDNARRATVRLVDRQAGREVGAGHRGRPAGRGHGLGCVPQGGDGRGPGADPRQHARPLGPAGRHGQGSGGLGSHCPEDGSAGAADEPQHASAPRGLRPRGRDGLDGRPRDCRGIGLQPGPGHGESGRLRRRPAGRRGGDPPLAAVPLPVPGGVPQRQRRSAAEDQGRAAQGGGDRLRQRPGAAGSGRDRPGRVGLDGLGGDRPSRPGATSKMRCVDVAALFAAAILRCNPDSVVIPFDTAAYEVKVDPSDSVLSLAERLARFGGGGTNCSLPLAAANARYHDRRFAGCVLVSDQESWVGAGRGGSTAVVTEWQEFVKNQMRLGSHGIPSPKLVCIDLQPYTTTQAPDRSDILNVGGFSDAVFSVVAAFLADDSGRFVAEVDAVGL